MGISLPTLVGFLFGLGLFLGSVFLSTDNYHIFFEFSALIMVVGGTLAVSFVAFEPRYVMQALRLCVTVFFSHKVGRQVLSGEVARMIRWGYLVQKGGMAALEGDARKLRDQDLLLAFGVDLVVTGYSGTEVREIMGNTVEGSFQRGTVPADILRWMASNSPAFGMIATLVGLIVMLDRMGSDPSKLGAGMALGLLGTLYGVLFARIILMPVAAKVQQREEIVRFRNYLVVEGLALLAERKSPRYIQDRMNSYLDPSLHFNIDKQMKSK